MPLLICPNDDQEMRKIVRDGVEIDICPSCRGVWLDRGELEKLLSEHRSDVEHLKRREERLSAAERSFADDPDDWRRRNPRGEWRERDDDDEDDWKRRGGKRRKSLDIFDIFDF